MTADLVARLRANPHGSIRIDSRNGINEPTQMIAEAASALESLSAENATLLDEVLRARQERTATIAFWKNIAKIFSGRAKVHLQQRNEAFERAAGKLELRADIHERTAKAAYSRQVRASAGAKASVLREAANHLRQLSKES